MCLTKVVPFRERSKGGRRGSDIRILYTVSPLLHPIK